MMTGARKLAFMLLCWWMLFPAGEQTAQAQNTASATLYPIETGSFPTITAYLDVRDAEGKYIQGLQASDVRALEDGQPRPLDSLSELRPGVQFVVAVAPGPSLGIRDTLGLSRYNYLTESLAAWAEALPRPLEDDLSLIIDGGPQVLHTTNAETWLTALQSYQAESRAVQPSLQALSQALDIADDTPARMGMGRAVLFITSPQPPEATGGLQNLVARAIQQSIRISIWYVASPDMFESPGAQQLQTVATQTGGQFFTFSHDEGVPNLEDTLEPLRNVYRLVYSSRITTSGSHQLAVEVSTSEMEVTSPPRSFDLIVQPPNPIFISPPNQIIRTEAILTGAKEQIKVTAASATFTLTPEKQLLEILIEFPDSHPRPVITATLYVDNAPVDQNSAIPFEQFIWNLVSYTESGQHRLRVEVIDSLGLVGSTIEVPVEIVVQRAQPSLWATISRNGALLAGLIVVLAGLMLALVLVLGGRVRPRILGRPAGDSRSPQQRKSSRSLKDPVTQPIAQRTEASRRWVNRLQLPQRHTAPTAQAFLTPLSDVDEDSVHKLPIPIIADEVTLGRSPTRAMIVLDHPSIEDVHTQIYREDGIFHISDQGSTAGTWLNYTPVPRDGSVMEHGDTVHIGRVGFRFNLRKPVHVRKLVIMRNEKVV